MYISDKLIFVELHKTACTHIGNWLSKLVPGEQVGKHNRVPPDLRNRFVVGSVRNPWDWYVSLWGYGCDRRGSVYTQTTRRVYWPYYWSQLPREMGRSYPTLHNVLTQLSSDLRQPVDEWKAVYQDSGNPELFRRWLKLVFDGSRRQDLGEGYGFSPVSKHSGLYTYRFLKLFSGLDGELYNNRRLGDVSQLRELWEECKITNHMIRQESLEADLIQGLRLAKVPLSDEDIQAIEAGKSQKTNTSSRADVSWYYDAECSELVAERERLIIDLFDYSAP